MFPRAPRVAIGAVKLQPLTATLSRQRSRVRVFLSPRCPGSLIGFGTALRLRSLDNLGKRTLTARNLKLAATLTFFKFSNGFQLEHLSLSAEATSGTPETQVWTSAHAKTHQQVSNAPPVTESYRFFLKRYCTKLICFSPILRLK